MLDLLLWCIVLLAITVGSYLEWKYALAGFPKEARWKIALFFWGSLATGLGGYLVVTRIDNNTASPLVGFVVSTLGGIMFAWFIPVRMRYIFPKKRDE